MAFPAGNSNWNLTGLSGLKFQLGIPSWKSSWKFQLRFPAGDVHLVFQLETPDILTEKPIGNYSWKSQLKFLVWVGCLAEETSRNFQLESPVRISSPKTNCTSPAWNFSLNFQLENLCGFPAGISNWKHQLEFQAE